MAPLISSISPAGSSTRALDLPLVLGAVAGVDVVVRVDLGPNLLRQRLVVVLNDARRDLQMIGPVFGRGISEGGDHAMALCRAESGCALGEPADAGKMLRRFGKRRDIGVDIVEDRQNGALREGVAQIEVGGFAAGDNDSGRLKVSGKIVEGGGVACLGGGSQRVKRQAVPVVGVPEQATEKVVQPWARLVRVPQGPAGGNRFAEVDILEIDRRRAPQRIGGERGKAIARVGGGGAIPVEAKTAADRTRADTQDRWHSRD